VLPSFVQTADAQTALDPIDVFGDPIDDPWGDWGGWADDDWGCQSLGCESSDDGGGGYSGGGNTGGNNGAVCVSEQELLQNVQVCVVATLGATGAAIGILNGAACSTCFLAPNIASCGTCAVLTVFTGFAVNIAADQCQPPEMEVCP